MHGGGRDCQTNWEGDERLRMAFTGSHSSNRLYGFTNWSLVARAIGVCVLWCSLFVMFISSLALLPARPHATLWNPQAASSYGEPPNRAVRATVNRN